MVLSDFELRLFLQFAVLIGILILSGLFVAYLIDAIRATEELVANDKRGKACASFVGLVFLILLYLG